MGPGERIERYEIMDTLGEGGMARVYLVRHVTLQTLHALKVLTMSSRALQARLEKEGQAQAQLRHENVVHVSDVLQVEGMPALVMEYVEGPDLHHWIREERPEPALAEQIFRGILAGLGAAHRAGMAHRDLKPANVLLSQDAEGRWIPKICDFGLVKVLTASTSAAKTRSGMMMGTPEYMAPEQIRDPSHVDHRADLFSLGCILYELLTYKRAYEGPDIVSIFQAIEEGQRAPLPPSVPPHLAALVDDCLQAAPERRPVDCDAIRRRLDAPAQAGVDANAVPPSPRGRAWLWVLGLTGAVALQLGCLGVVWSAMFSSEEAAGTVPAKPCSPSPDLMGWVLAPRGDSSTWVTWTDVPVFESPPEAETAGSALCVLPAGTRVRAVSSPIRTPEGTFVQVQKGLPPGDAPGLEAEPIPTRAPAEQEGPCLGPPGERVGWFYTRPHAFAPRPAKGRTWTVSSPKDVVVDYPRGDNGEQSGAVVCQLKAGTTVQIEEEPVREGKGYWVPVVAGTVRDR